MLFQDLIKHWGRVVTPHHVFYKHPSGSFSIQHSSFENERPLIMLLAEHCVTVAVKRSVLADFSDWVDIINNYIPQAVIETEADSNSPF